MSQDKLLRNQHGIFSSIFKDKTLRTLTLVWLSWFLIIYGFQWVVTTRMDVAKPDYALDWTKYLTMPHINDGKIYLIEPFLNRQVAWDSEYYLGIAVGGYNDPAAGTIQDPLGKKLIKNYAFFPAYPYVIKTLMVPLRLLCLSPIATAALAGIIVSLLGTLAGMIALWDMTRKYLSEEDQLRSVIYMLIFPSAFFFAQVYTEGMFIGLTFWSLALMIRKQWLLAAVLASIAAWTRAHGAILALPLGIAWLRTMDRENLRNNLSWTWLAQGASVLLPVIAYLIWRNSTLGENWEAINLYFFHRSALSLVDSINSWQDFFLYAFVIQKRDAMIYFGFEAFCTVLTMIASLSWMKRAPEISAFSLMVVVISATTGLAFGLARYVLVAPALYIFLSQLGRNKLFDRTWTVCSILLLAMFTLLFSCNMWVG